MNDADRSIQWSRSTYLWLGALLVVNIVVRVLLWQRTILLDGHDSVGLLWWSAAFASFDPRAIIGLNPDASLFYPFLAAVFSLPGWSLETGARMASLFSAVVLFVALAAIGRQIARPAAVLIALVLLTFNPVVAPLFIAVFTEPSYVATVYVGLAVFWLQYRQPTLGGAALAGLIFGLAFLNRLEGLLCLGFVPVMLLLHQLWKRPQGSDLRQALAWCAVFVLCFSALAALQVWRVSHEMGALALNGRQVWTLLFHSPAFGLSEDEKLFGLLFDPAVTNLNYLHMNLSAAATIATESGGFAELAQNLLRTFVFNLEDLYMVRLTALFGHLVVVFFVFGLLHLWLAGKSFEVVLVLAFIACGLFAPLLHNVVLRHILVVAPMVLLVAGIGIVALSETLARSTRNPSRRKSGAIAGLLVLMTLAGWALDLSRAFHTPASNWQYSPKELEQPITLIREVAATHPERRPRLASRWAYLALYADAQFVHMPYTDFDGLVRYFELNDVDLLYLAPPRTSEYPFIEKFADGSSEERFTLLYRGQNAQGEPVSLYRFRR